MCFNVDENISFHQASEISPGCFSFPLIFVKLINPEQKRWLLEKLTLGLYITINWENLVSPHLLSKLIFSIATISYIIPLRSNKNLSIPWITLPSLGTSLKISHYFLENKMQSLVLSHSKLLDENELLETIQNPFVRIITILCNNSFCLFSLPLPTLIIML